MSEAPVRVLLVDDDDLMRAGLKAVLSSDEIEVVGEASDGRAALEQVRVSARPYVLMDVRMPDLDGISATRRSWRAHPR